MKKEFGSKTLSIFVVVAMLISALAVTLLPTAAAAVPCKDKVWEGIGNSTGNFVNTSTSDLYYGNTVTIEFNGSVLNNVNGDIYLYHPGYTYGPISGYYAYNVTWTPWGKILYNTGTGKWVASNVNLNYSGMWVVCNVSSGAVPTVEKANMSDMTFYYSTAGWQNILGWFWVNSTKYYTVTVSPSKIHYDKNESVTITVKHGDQEVGGAWVDIRKNDDLIWHKHMTAGTWTFNPYDYTHNNGAGVYNIIVYKDVDSTVITYGDEGSTTGYNDSFGDPSIWTSMKIANSTSVLNSHTEETYNYSTCGPFDPPEYTADMVNLTVVAGVPQLSIPEEYATQYWNFTGIVNINAKDYDGHNLTFNPSDVKLYNKSNAPTKSGATPIDNKYYNVSTGPGWIKIEPAYPNTMNNWGKNISTGYVWAPKGKIYVVVAASMKGNASEEWNGTTYFTLTTAPAVQIFMKNYLNKEIPAIPDIDNQPINIWFQVVNRDHAYLDEGKYITISGNALMAENGKTLDKLPGAVYTGSNNTWKVPVTPTMALNGGEIVISVDWPGNGTATETLTVGGSKLNGSIVSISPSEFVIGQNVTLTVTVTGPTGYPYPNADVSLYYINESGKLWGKINETVGGGTTNGEYTFLFNVSQQTTGQPWSPYKAPRYIAAYVKLPNVGANPYAYGYAYATMKPKSDLKVEMSKDTFMAGQTTDFSINVSTVDPLTGNKTGTPADSGLHVEIYNETGENVTSDFVGWGWSPLNNDATLEFTSVYALKQGTYTVYAYNNTHNSEGFNATFTVVPVTVSCDKSEFIYMYDNNISATFTVKWQDIPVGNGTLTIYNMSKTSYNQTWIDGSSIPDIPVVNGVVTINNITANNLPTGVGLRNITFAYKPEASGSIYANATGKIPVKVPDATPSPDMVALSEPANVKVTVTGRGEPLDGVFVSIAGPGNLAMNGTTGSDGTITFSFVPTATGDININVYNRSTGSKIAITAHTLNINAPAQANEGNPFTVTVKDEVGNPVDGALVTFAGDTKSTDSNGQVTFTGEVAGTLPYITYTITATKAGYRSAETTIMIANVPQLYLNIPDKVAAGQKFTVKVTSDSGAVYGVAVTFNGETKTVTGDGVDFTAPTKVSSNGQDFPITATKDGYKSASGSVHVVPSTPGFELITLIAAIGIAFILLRRRR